MKYFFYLGIIIFLKVGAVFAQPLGTGGGGLNISYITYFMGDTLSFSDENFKINHYVMNKKFTNTEFQFEDLQRHKLEYNTGERPWFYLPRDYYDNKLKPCPNQRLEIIYKMDTMIVDFVGVMNVNSSDYTEQLDCIRFFPGYYKMYLTESERFDSCWNLRNEFPDQIEKLRADMRIGITPNTMNNLKGWHILEEAFNPNVNVIWARVNREHCSETGQGTFPTKNATRLCAGMITLTNSHININTVQKSMRVQDTLTLSYYYYFVFGAYHSPSVVAVNDKANSEHQNFPSEENQIAQSYLDAVEKFTLYINGTRYTGKIILFVQRNYPDLFSFSHLEETHYYYREGKLVYEYVPVKAQPAFNERN